MIYSNRFGIQDTGKTILLDASITYPLFMLLTWSNSVKLQLETGLEVNIKPLAKIQTVLQILTKTCLTT